MIRKEDVYQIGRITKAHALKGEVNFMFTDDIFDRVDADYLICDVDGILVPFFIKEYRFRSDTTALVKFCDLNTADKVQFLIGCDVYFERKIKEILEEEYEWQNGEVPANYFIGYKIIDSNNDNEIGEVVDIDDNTENMLFIVNTTNGHEIMIPAHEEFIIDIDRKENVIIMDLPFGLIDIQL